MIDATTLAGWVVDSRERTMELVADLSDDQLIGPLLAVVNPLLWEIGHLAWFQEKFVLRDACQEAPILPFADAIWDSGAIPHDTRWRLALPTREETLAYMREVRDRVADRVTDAGASDVVRHLALYTVYHEDMHTEAITYTRQTLGYPPPKLIDLPPAPRGPAPPPPRGDAEIPGGTFLLGATRDLGFVFDNEKWAHQVEVAPFAIARAAVTQAEFATFVDDGGYRRTELWSTEGWEWRERTGAENPVYWRRDGDGWQRRHFDRWVGLEADVAVCHVSFHEADAYCRWAARRLPTEAEWEFAAATAPGVGRYDTPAAKRRFPWGEETPDPARANLDWEAMGPVEVGRHAAGDGPWGVRQLVGNVWEWTATTFDPYPNFEQDAYRDMSLPWFGTRKVLRGGAWATRARFLRNTLRNYFTPDRRDVLAGFRTCAPRG